MKYLLFILLSFSVFACGNSSNIEDTIAQSEQILNDANKYLSKELDGCIYELTYMGGKRRSHEKRKIALKRGKIVQAKCEEVIKTIGKADNPQFFLKIREDYVNWVKQKNKDWDLEMGLGWIFSNGTIQNEQDTSRNFLSRKIIKNNIYLLTILMLHELGANRKLNGGSSLYHPRVHPILLLANQKQVEEYEELDLCLTLPGYWGSSWMRVANISQGSIEETRTEDFEINIPTNKLGKQVFDIKIHIRNLRNNIDSMLHFNHHFEVIE